VSAPALFDRKLLLSRRERARRSGGIPDFLLRRVAVEIHERIPGFQRHFARILFHGAFGGALRDSLAPELFPNAFSVAMEDHQAASECPLTVIADEEALPFRDGAFDLIVSALSIQLLNDLPGALIQIRRALKPDGLFLAATLGGTTLNELRTAFAEAESELEGGISPRVAPMADIRDFGALLQRAGFALPVTDADPVIVTYATPFALMQDLRAMGATNPLTDRRKQPLRRATLQRAAEIYAERFPAPGGRVRATFEIIHLAGWSPHDSQQKPLKPGSAQARLADALGAIEHPFKTR
jgi:SAM-dependent methyltransferase